MMFQAIEKLENDFAYVRFMGERDLLHFDKIYRHEDTLLKIWKDEIEKIKAKNTFVYFSNFFEGHAPASVNKLKELFGQKIMKQANSKIKALYFRQNLTIGCYQAAHLRTSLPLRCLLDVGRRIRRLAASFAVIHLDPADTPGSFDCSRLQHWLENAD